MVSQGIWQEQYCEIKVKYFWEETYIDASMGVERMHEALCTAH